MPPAPDPDIFGGPLWAERANALALELERERMDEQRNKKAWVKKGNHYLFIKAVETVRLPTCVVIDGAVGLPIPVLMRIP